MNENSINIADCGTSGETEVLAFQLWEQAERPDGRALEFWLEAERRILARNSPAPLVAVRKPNAKKVATVKPAKPAAKNAPKSKRLAAS